MLLANNTLPAAGIAELCLILCVFFWYHKASFVSATKHHNLVCAVHASMVYVECCFWVVHHAFLRLQAVHVCANPHLPSFALHSGQIEHAFETSLQQEHHLRVSLTAGLAFIQWPVACPGS